jgi:DNA-directed RNA polymerase specialized sigma24 family protein
MTINGEFEYFVAVKAKSGDKHAARVLWEAYRPMMIGMLRGCKYLTVSEKESEAALVFFRKLELFDPAKVNKLPEQWTFSYMLTGGMKNARNKIQNHCKRESIIRCGLMEQFFEEPISTATSDYPIGGFLPVNVVDFNPYEYWEKNNPELYALRIFDGSMQTKLRRLQKRISPLEAAILEFRRAGLSIRAIADQMGCSQSTIKNHIKKAKSIASRVFDIDFSPSRRLSRA